MAIPLRIERSVRFIRRNPFVLYSFVLIVAVTGVIFFNTYYFLGKFQGTVDDLLKSKAFLSESVFGTLIQDSLSDTDLLKRRLRQLKKEHADVTAIVILARSEEERNFRIIASTDVEDAGQKFSFQDSVSYPFRRTWSDQSATGYITNVNGERLWNVVKAIDRDDGERVGLVLFQVSLKEHDLFVQSAMRQVYAVALVSLMLVLGLIGIHVRLYGFAIRATKLEEVDRMKDDFISMASHELRSPLTVLRGYIDILKSGFLAKMPSVDSEEANRYLNNMEESVTRLNNLVEDILNVSRLEQNRLPIQMETIDLDPLLSKLVSQFALEAKQHGLTLSYEAIRLPMVRGDIDRVTQIVVNMLSNAIKYTPGGSVTVLTKETDDAILVTVADTGLGISAEGMKNLFSKFYRVKTEKTLKITGTGLGLWISREIARKMDGDITAESIEGVGSHFTLHLQKSVKEKRV
jgi:signal transduction histidine kinase